MIINNDKVVSEIHEHLKSISITQREEDVDESENTDSSDSDRDLLGHQKENRKLLYNLIHHH